MTKNIYFASLGSLAKSDMSKSIAAFANILEKESSFPYYTTARIWTAFITDKFYYKTIDNYKLGYLNTSEFKTQISYQLGIKESSEFEPAWNAMCELSQETLTQIINIFQQQQTLCIISATNRLQYNYVIKQINQELTHNNLPKIENNPDITIVTSFEENYSALAELAKIAIDEHNWDSHEYSIISYDNRLTKENLGLQNAEFIYDPEL